MTIINSDRDTGLQESNPVEEGSPETNDVKNEIQSINTEAVDTPDSVKESSASKYNFIFYLLYKFKFDSETSP